MVENQYMTYGGNRLASVRDNATQLTYEGATDFNGEPNKEYPLTYNDAGSLISDAGRKIAKIDYDYLNNPVRIQFTDGNVTKYIYSATGEKLRVIYQTAVPNIAVAIGDTKELAPSEIQCTDYNDYLLKGNLTLKNGHIDKYQFEEGYCQAEKNSSNANIDDFTFYYYDKDHLGNIRQVTKADGSQTGNVVQTINYYPFGMQFCDGNTCDIDQKHKYNGKEFDNMHGLNTYDYGARQYNPVTARWDRMDPLCEKYYNVSPYTYCVNNPMKNIDLDGRMCGDYYSMNGNFLATDGIDDNMKYIIYDDKEAKNTRKTGSVESVHNAMEVPSDEQINSGQTSFDEGYKIGKETGFVMGGGTTSSILNGDDNSVNLGKGYEELQQKGIKVQSDAHYHPLDFRSDGKGNYTCSNTNPSIPDKNWRMLREENGLNDPKSPSWILGSELNGPVTQGENGKLDFHTTESIRFYTGNYTSKPYSWKQFKEVVRKLNRK